MSEECFNGYSTKNEDKTAYSKPRWRPVDNTTRNDQLLQLCPKPWRYQHAEKIDTRPSVFTELDLRYWSRAHCLTPLPPPLPLHFVLVQVWEDLIMKDERSIDQGIYTN